MSVLIAPRFENVRPVPSWRAYGRVPSHNRNLRLSCGMSRIAASILGLGVAWSGQVYRAGIGRRYLIQTKVGRSLNQSRLSANDPKRTCDAATDCVWL